MAGLMMVLVSSILAQKDDDSIVSLQRCWQYPSAIADDQPAADKDNVYVAEPGGRVSAISLIAGARVWSTELGGEVSSDITTDGANVYVVTSDANGGSHLRSLSVASGIPDWKLEFPSGRHLQIALVGELLIVAADSGEISAYRPVATKPVWSLTLPEKITGIFPASRSILIATGGRKLHSIDVASGKATAVYQADADIVTAIADGDEILTGDGRGNVIKFVGGSPSWRFRNGARITVLLETPRGVIAASADNFVYLVSAYNGDVRWKKRMPARVASVTVAGDLAVVTSVGESNAVLIDLESGKPAGRVSLSDEELFVRSPVYVENKFVFFTTAGVFAASRASCSGN
jgi:outer membrane protein assembly factor BamB